MSRHLLIEYVFTGPKELLNSHSFHKERDWKFYRLNGYYAPKKLIMHTFLRKFEEDFVAEYSFGVENIAFKRVEIMDSSERETYIREYWDNEPEMIDEED